VTDKPLPSVAQRLAIIRDALERHAVPKLDALDSRLRHEVVADLTINPPSEMLAHGCMQVRVVSHRIPTVSDIQAVAEEALARGFDDQAVREMLGDAVPEEPGFPPGWTTADGGRELTGKPLTWYQHPEHGNVGTDGDTVLLDDGGDSEFDGNDLQMPADILRFALAANPEPCEPEEDGTEATVCPCCLCARSTCICPKEKP
jgi:hypothetical protein